VPVAQKANKNRERRCSLERTAKLKAMYNTPRNLQISQDSFSKTSKFFCFLKGALKKDERLSVEGC
jgi:hypothetical protein